MDCSQLARGQMEFQGPGERAARAPLGLRAGADARRAESP
jgi:hypothetical protein